MITERKIYITTDETEFDEADYSSPEEARTKAEDYEAEYQYRHSLIGKELFFRDENLNVCDYDEAIFVFVATKQAIDALDELCDEWGYDAPWKNCKRTFYAKTGFFMYNQRKNYWVDMDMEIEKMNAAKSALMGGEAK